MGRKTHQSEGRGEFHVRQFVSRLIEQIPIVKEHQKSAESLQAVVPSSSQGIAEISSRKCQGCE